MRTQERINQMNDVINGIARRSAYKFKTKSSEELAQELWVHVLEKEEEKGKELDLNLVAKICYDRIVDIQRFDARRNASSFEDLEQFMDTDECDTAELRPGTYNDGNLNDRIMVQDLFKIFPEGSRERTFLEYWGTASGINDFGYKGDGIYGDGYTEKDLARKLGFASCSNGGYRSFRKKMRVFVIEYFKD